MKFILHCNIALNATFSRFMRLLQIDFNICEADNTFYDSFLSYWKCSCTKAITQKSHHARKKVSFTVKIISWAHSCGIICFCINNTNCTSATHSKRLEPKCWRHAECSSVDLPLRLLALNLSIVEGVKRNDVRVKSKKHIFNAFLNETRNLLASPGISGGKSEETGEYSKRLERKSLIEVNYQTIIEFNVIDIRKNVLYYRRIFGLTCLRAKVLTRHVRTLRSSVFGWKFLDFWWINLKIK